MNNNVKTKEIKTKLLHLLKGEFGLILILILLCIIFAFSSPFFLTSKNLINVTRQISIVLIVALGMLCVVLIGEIDLSVGSSAALSGMVCAWILLQSESQVLAIAGAIIAGVLIGAFNGVMIIYGKIPSFIVTLASMGILRGIVLVWSQGKSMSGLPAGFSFLGAGYIGKMIPVSSLVTLILVGVFIFLLHKTKHGVYLKAIGSNNEAAELSAIPVKRYKMSAFIITGVLCAIGGIIITSKLLSAQPTAGDGLEMDVLSAVILGGASLSGGVGTVTGTVVGALTIGIINNGMNLLKISPFFQQIVKGTIILLAVLARRKNKN